MKKQQVTATAEFSVMQYLLNATLSRVELRKDITDGSDRQATVCFNTAIEVFGGK